MAALGVPAFRADQVSRHYFARLADDPSAWTDIPAALRDDLADALTPPLMTSVRELTADEGTTRKTLWRLFDGALVESVLMRYPDRVTMCVSSQAGCGMNCPFCATGQAGLTRNLSHGGDRRAGRRRCSRARARRRARRAGPGLQRRVHGHGRAAGQLQGGRRRRCTGSTDRARRGSGMSARGITVSTVGLVPRMRELADEGLPVTLAVSLHAPDDELRDTLVPVNTRWKVAEVLDAAWDYARATHRRVSIEYALIKDINDQAWRADLLGERLRGKLVHVNLIPLNPTPGLEVDGVAAARTSASSSAASRPAASP